MSYASPNAETTRSRSVSSDIMSIRRWKSGDERRHQARDHLTTRAARPAPAEPELRHLVLHIQRRVHFPSQRHRLLGDRRDGLERLRPSLEPQDLEPHVLQSKHAPLELLLRLRRALVDVGDGPALPLEIGEPADP